MDDYIPEAEYRRILEELPRIKFGPSVTLSMAKRMADHIKQLETEIRIWKGEDCMHNRPTDEQDECWCPRHRGN